VVSRLGDVYVYNGSMLQKGDCMLLLVHLGNVAQKEGIGTEDLRFLLENGLPLPTRVTKRLQIEHFEMWLKEEKQREDWDEALRANGNRHAKARHAMRSKYAASLHKRYGKKLWYDVLCKYQTIPERVIELVNENTAKKNCRGASDDDDASCTFPGVTRTANDKSRAIKNTGGMPRR
jgi:hypothetical protein